MSRIQHLLTPDDPLSLRHRRGPQRQRRRRGNERRARVSAVAFWRWCRRRGMAEGAIAERLGLTARTLRRWIERWSRDRIEPQPLGRRIERADRELRRSLLALFALMGPTVGLPMLQGLFPDVRRAELVELQRWARRVMRRGRRWLAWALRWHRAGTVWAIDFTDPPAAIDGIYRVIFCVRDLASGQQLLALPCRDSTAHAVLGALRALVRYFGAPLVIKCDNGPAFIAHDFKMWAEENGIALLYSPPGTPEYNGAIEAGIGQLAVRAHHEAARCDRPGVWTSDDVEAARLQANETSRPRGLAGPTPDEAWRFRCPVGPADRELFRDTCAAHAAREMARDGRLPGVHLDHYARASIDRIAISRALIDHGFLSFRRRRIPLPISRWKAVNIS